MESIKGQPDFINFENFENIRKFCKIMREFRKFQNKITLRCETSKYSNCVIVTMVRCRRAGGKAESVEGRRGRERCSREGGRYSFSSGALSQTWRRKVVRGGRGRVGRGNEGTAMVRLRTVRGRRKGCVNSLGEEIERVRREGGK